MNRNMNHSRCPHYIRHGTFNRKTQNMEFKNQCGLLIQRHAKTHNTKTRARGKPQVQDAHLPELPKGTPLTCNQVPFAKDFNYFSCPTYQETFQSGDHRYNAMPTKDIQFSKQLSGSGLGDMELL
ncbi:MAG: hypothetical protein OXC44_01480 [Proteobacteria bacterium]|nr:hypothetical protein [Pseudomonadota bacterium]